MVETTPERILMKFFKANYNSDYIVTSYLKEFVYFVTMSSGTYIALKKPAVEKVSLKTIPELKQKYQWLDVNWTNTNLI